MEAALTPKPEASVKSQVAIPVRPEAIEGENGAPVGMPIFPSKIGSVSGGW